jgi:TPR repeat protein
MRWSPDAGRRDSVDRSGGHRRLARYQRGDFAAARAAYEHDARLGDRSREFSLATMLLRGEGGAADPVTGVDWLRKAAEAGMAQARVQPRLAL